MTLEELQNDYLNANTIFLSFPKSGRTWIRYFIAKYIEYLTRNEFSLELHTIKDVPNILFSHNYFDLNQNNPGTPEIISKEILNNKKLFFIVRDPRDVAVSYYHQKSLREGGNVGDIDEFVLSEVYGIERQSDFVIKLIEYYTELSNAYLVKYEDIRNNPYDQFYKIIETIFDNVNIDLLNKAIEESSFEKMKQYEINMSLKNSGDFLRMGKQNWNGDENALKVRKGKVNSFANELKPGTIEAINSLKRTSQLIELLKTF